MKNGLVSIGKMAEMMAEKVVNPEERRLIISHCNALQRAEQFKEGLLSKIKVKECLIMDTRGISSMYANDGGVIVTL